MRKIIVLSFVSLDGVMQAPGGPDEDKTSGFKYGGWTVPYFDDYLGKVMGEQMANPFDLLLGRVTYDIFAGYWPSHNTDETPPGPAMNKAVKYVVTHNPRKYTWERSVPVTGDIEAEVRKLKAQDGPELQVHGSANLIQTLLKLDLIDEMRLKTFPVTLGAGKKLFAEGTIPAAFKLASGSITPSGVIVVNYERAGKVKTGSF